MAARDDSVREAFETLVRKHFPSNWIEVLAEFDQAAASSPTERMAVAPDAAQGEALRETLRKVLREHKVFRYQSRRKMGEGFSFDEDDEGALLDDMVAVLEAKAAEQ